VKDSKDPLTEPIVPFVPKKEETPEEEKTEWNPTTQRYEKKVTQKALTLKTVDEPEEGGTVYLDPKEVPKGAEKQDENSVDLNAIAEDWHRRGYW